MSPRYGDSAPPNLNVRYFFTVLSFNYLMITELRKPASSTSVLAEHSHISQEHIVPINKISPHVDMKLDKYIPTMT